MAYCKKEKANYHSKYVGNFQYLVKKCLQEEKLSKKKGKEKMKTHLLNKMLSIKDVD